MGDYLILAGQDEKVLYRCFFLGFMILVWVLLISYLIFSRVYQSHFESTNFCCPKLNILSSSRVPSSFHLHCEVYQYIRFHSQNSGHKVAWLGMKVVLFLLVSLDEENTLIHSEKPTVLKWALSQTCHTKVGALTTQNCCVSIFCCPMQPALPKWGHAMAVLKLASHLLMPFLFSEGSKLQETSTVEIWRFIAFVSGPSFQRGLKLSSECFVVAKKTRVVVELLTQR